jgi:hypothetical protein
MDRRHWILLAVALACLIGLGAWILELDVGLRDGLDGPQVEQVPR